MIIDKGRDVICDICGKTENVLTNCYIPDTWNFFKLRNTVGSKIDLQLTICGDCFSYKVKYEPAKRKSIAQKVISYFKAKPLESEE